MLAWFVWLEITQILGSKNQDGYPILKPGSSQYIETEEISKGVCVGGQQTHIVFRSVTLKLNFPVIYLGNVDFVQFGALTMIARTSHFISKRNKTCTELFSTKQINEKPPSCPLLLERSPELASTLISLSHRATNRQTKKSSKSLSPNSMWCMDPSSFSHLLQKLLSESHEVSGSTKQPEGTRNQGTNFYFLAMWGCGNYLLK